MKKFIFYSTLVLMLSRAEVLAETEFSGYYKNLLSSVHISAPESNDEIIDYQRLRLKLESEPTDWIGFQVHCEASSIWGDTSNGIDYSSISTSQFATAELPLLSMPRPRFMNLESENIDESKFSLRTEVDRLRIKFQTDKVSLALGRQSVSWGSGYFWAPTDIFSSFSPTEIDRDQKIGIDVIRLTAFPNQDLEIDLVIEPLDRTREWHVDSDDSSVAIRVKGNIAEYDIAVCAGRIAEDNVLGFDFSGYILNAGFHGDLLNIEVNDPSENDYIKAVVGIDYAFQASFNPYIMIEYYFNGAGTENQNEYPMVMAKPSVQDALWRGTAFSLGQHYIGTTLSLSPSSLTSLQAQTIINLDDQSFYEYVSFAISTSDNTELILGASLAFGDLGTEFGGLSEEQIGYNAGSADMYITYFKAYF